MKVYYKKRMAKKGTWVVRCLLHTLLYRGHSKDIEILNLHLRPECKDRGGVWKDIHML